MTKSTDDKLKTDSNSSEEVAGTLSLKDSTKYQAILDKSLDAYKSSPEEEEDAVGKTVIHEPWSIRKIRILGSIWFVMLIFLFLGNLIVFVAFRSVEPDLFSLRGAEEELQREIPGAEEDINPFQSFLALTSEVTDSDYSSFLQAISEINRYFPRQEFEITAQFKEEGFHFQNKGIYYLDPQ